MVNELTIDKLDKIFEKQKELQAKLGNLPLISYKDRQEYININILSCLDELSEVLRETQWKNPNVIKFGWKKAQEFNLDNYRKELIDLFHFFINLCLAGGIDSKMLFKMYIEKNEVNHERQKENY